MRRPNIMLPERSISALELSHVSADYGGAPALRDVSIRVERGQVVALLGPNGAGKTTILRTAAGLVRPTSGRIALAGHEVTAKPAEERARRGLCLISEGRAVFRSLTVRENLMLFSGADRGADPGAITRALDAFPILKERLSQPAGHLSGGQQQMLALARGYICQPSILLLDELSMGLAPILVDQIFGAIEELASSGVALLLVEQYVDRAIEIAHEVVLIGKGQVSFDGPADSLDREAVAREYMGGTG